VIKNKKSTFFKLSANLLIIASVVCVLFGNGTHLHSVFDHFSDHGDIHIHLHAHSSDSGVEDTGHAHSSDLDDRDAHEHPTATVDLNGTISQKTSNSSFDIEISSLAVGLFTEFSFVQEYSLEFQNLPPPKTPHSTDFFSSLLLRGPPVG